MRKSPDDRTARRYFPRRGKRLNALATEPPREPGRKGPAQIGPVQHDTVE